MVEKEIDKIATLFATNIFDLKELLGVGRETRTSSGAARGRHSEGVRTAHSAIAVAIWCPST